MMVQKIYCKYLDRNGGVKIVDPDESAHRSAMFAILSTSLKNYQGPVVQSIFNSTSSLMVKMLNVLVSTISNSQIIC